MENQNKGRKKGFLIGLGIFAAGMLSFFGYQYWQSKKTQTEVPDENAPDFKAEKPKTTKPPVSKPKKAPAKKHSTKKPGSSTASQSNSESASSTMNTAANVADAIKQNAADPALIAKGLYAALRIKSFSTALRILKTIKSPLQYAEVGRSFSKYFIGGVRQTIVNAMFNTFKTAEQKQKLKQVFTAIGLKYDDKKNKWSLEGISEGKFIITTRPTKVWKDPRTSVEVPHNMVLGREIAKRKSHTLFRNGKQYFLVHSDHVNHYKH